MKTFGCPRAGLGPPAQATIRVSTIIMGTSAIRSIAHFLLVCFVLPSRSINLRFLVSSSDHVWPVWVTSSAKIFKIQKYFIINLLKICATFCLVKLAFVKFLCICTFVEWNDATLNDFEQPDFEQHFETTFFRSDVWHNLANLDAMTYFETQIQKCRDEIKFPLYFDSRNTEFGIRFGFSKCTKTLPLNIYFLLKKLLKVPFWRKKLKLITT